MVIDSSAPAAILFDEINASQLTRKISNDPTRLMSAASILETGIALEYRRGFTLGREFDFWLMDSQVEIVPVDAEQVAIARDAWRQFGKGNHKAGLNFGDCFSYALSKVSGEPLLFVGNDFALTDVEAVS